MIHYLSKILVLPFYPLGLSIALILTSIVFILLHKRTFALASLTLSVLVLLAFSLPAVSHFLVRMLEKQYSPSVEYPRVDAIVLLGGSEVPKMPPRVYDETNQHGDRIMHAARLFKKGCASRIIVTGGKNSFIYNFPGSESDVSYRLLTELFGIDSAMIIRESRARNTHDNGTYVKEIMDTMKLKPNILLVTSAIHMPRSVAIFKKLGFTVHAAPTDYKEDAIFQVRFMGFVPNADALFKSTQVIHELYGMAAYRVLGWM